MRRRVLIAVFTLAVAGVALASASADAPLRWFGERPITGAAKVSPKWI